LQWQKREIARAINTNAAARMRMIARPPMTLLSRLIL
jgi:hypothetical protein